MAFGPYLHQTDSRKVRSHATYDDGTGCEKPMTDVCAIAFTPAPATDSPNLHSKREDAVVAFHGLIDLCFSSVRRWNPDLDLALITTTPPGPDLEKRLAELGAQILITPFRHQPPPGFFRSFNASLFSIDALACLADTYSGPDDRLALIDPDVVCTRELDGLFRAIPEDGFLAYNTEYPSDHVCQGLSARTAGQLHFQLDPRLTGFPLHYGGELYGYTPMAWSSISAQVEAAWRFSIAQWKENLPQLVTEEHLLNFALRYTQVKSADKYIRRIWTAPTHRTVLPTDSELPLWHLPAEKHRGLARMLPSARNRESWFWRSPQTSWQESAASHFGIPRRNTLRLLHDVTALAMRRTQSIVTSR
jgi:hypothetical protein